MPDGFATLAPFELLQFTAGRNAPVVLIEGGAVIAGGKSLSQWEGRSFRWIDIVRGEGV